ncbi:MAG: hypothetical protein P1T08_12125 [Acidimicrobiia bacterium]|nr:hypothetical protein [Acidimicrobiia bacterium]
MVTSSATTALTSITAPPKGPPTLEVNSPEDGETVTQRSKLFFGSVERGCTVTAKGGYEAIVPEPYPQAPTDAPSQWWLILELTPGGNTFTFTASCPSAASTQVELTVTYDPKPFVFYDQIELRGDGLGLIDFGDPAEEALERLISVLGPPGHEYSCVPEYDMDSCLYGHPAEDYYAEAHWQLHDGVGLTVTFSDWHLFRDDGVPHFDAWYLTHMDMLYGFHGMARSMPFDIRSPLATSAGIAIGATVSDLQDAYGGDLSLPNTADECTGQFEFSIKSAPGLGGAVCGDPTDPEARICIINAGQRSSC